MHPAGFSVEVIDHIEGAKAPTMVEGIAHEVHAPDLVRCLGLV